MKSGVGRLVLTAATLASLAGCGSSSTDGDAKFAEFLGVWQFTKVTAVEECMTVASASFAIDMNQWMLPGVTSDLASPGLFFGLCPFKFNVADKVATMVSEQCDVGILNGTMDYYTPQSGKFTLLSATTAEESSVMMGKISFMTPSTGAITQLDCMLTIQGTLIKAAND